ncbi:hypothetical protein [Fibrella aquatica]|uniref:hypothetical protein n=1 Tax=Fibrella aquatica TaxID=3242487 RepID=UPI003520373F
MKFTKILLLLVVCLLWLGGCSQTMMRYLYKTNVIADDYQYGDLYRLSNLPQFKDPVAPCPPRTFLSDTARTHLYVIGDSFTEPERLGKQDLPVSYFKRVQWDKQDTVQLDPAAHNVLLIESVERHFREHAAASASIQNLLVVKDTNRTNSPETDVPSLGKQLADAIHSEGIEERLETVLFSQAIFLWFKELKATLNLAFFERVSPNVSLSQNKEHLFIALDTDSTKLLNAGTSPLSDQEVNGLVSTINKTATHYQSVGFDKVILSIIPNKATILDPTLKPYNYLIERVQRHPDLNVPVVDIYSLYRQQTKSVYALGDSHWNCTGRALWLNTIANTLH